MHYSVLVIAKPEDDLDSLLYLFDENRICEKHIIRTRKEIIDCEKDYQKKVANGEYKLNNSNYKKKLLSAKTDEEFLELGKDDYFMYDEDGNEWSDRNELGRYDWYELGGRWSGYMHRKDGSECNYCEISELSTKVSKEDYDKAIRFWEVLIDKEELLPGETPPNAFYNEDYYKRLYEDKYDYARCTASFLTHSIVYNGDWKEASDFGSYNQYLEYTNDIIESVPENYIIYVVDCHE